MDTVNGGRVVRVAGHRDFSGEIEKIERQNGHNPKPEFSEPQLSMVDRNLKILSPRLKTPNSKP